MDDCLFCKIVSGKLPSYKVYEDKQYLGFLDINPLTKGNSLLIPKTHYRWVTDLPDFGDYLNKAKIIAQATKKVLHTESTSFLTLGYEIPHAHIRIIPRYPNDNLKKDLNINTFIKLSSEEMQKIAHEIYTEINS